MKVMGALWLYIGMSKSFISTVYNTMVKIPINLMVTRIPDKVLLQFKKYGFTTVIV